MLGISAQQEANYETSRKKNKLEYLREQSLVVASKRMKVNRSKPC